MIYRILVGVGLTLLGYYVGREVGRAEPIRKELEEGRGTRERHLESEHESGVDVNTGKDNPG